MGSTPAIARTDHDLSLILAAAGIRVDTPTVFTGGAIGRFRAHGTTAFPSFQFIHTTTQCRCRHDVRRGGVTVRLDWFTSTIVGMNLKAPQLLFTTNGTGITFTITRTSTTAITPGVHFTTTTTIRR